MAIIQKVLTKETIVNNMLIVFWRWRGKEHEARQNHGQVKGQGIWTNGKVTKDAHESYICNRELWKAIHTKGQPYGPMNFFIN